MFGGVYVYTLYLRMYVWWYLSIYLVSDDVCLVVFMYLVFPRMLGGLVAVGDLGLCSCEVISMPINPPPPTTQVLTHLLLC